MSLLGESKTWCIITAHWQGFQRLALQEGSSRRAATRTGPGLKGNRLITAWPMWVEALPNTALNHKVGSTPSAEVPYPKLTLLLLSPMKKVVMLFLAVVSTTAAFAKTGETRPLTRHQITLTSAKAAKALQSSSMGGSCTVRVTTKSRDVSICKLPPFLGQSKAEVRQPGGTRWES